MNRLEIEICPFEPRASLGSDPNRTQAIDLLACCASGDAEPACQHVLDTYQVQFTIWDSGLGEMREASPDDIESTCRAIYFDSDSDFTDHGLAALYLVWEAAFGYQSEMDEENREHD